MANTSSTPNDIELQALAATANAAYREAQQLVRSALSKWIEVGQVLLRAKEIVAHGNYSAWVEANCVFGERQGRKYRTLAELWSAADDTIRNSDSVLAATSLEEVLSILRPRPAKTTPVKTTSRTATDPTDLLAVVQPVVSSIEAGPSTAAETTPELAPEPGQGAEDAEDSPSSGIAPTYDPYTDDRPRLLWTASDQNEKTGPVLTSYVGPTLEHLLGSCQGCALLSGRCYAWNSRQRASAQRVLKKAAEDLRYYDLAHAVARYEATKPKKKVARLCAIGDPARVPHIELIFAIETLKARGYTILAYTHHWRDRKNRKLKNYVLASCNSQVEADEARALGWIPSVLLPPDHQKRTFTTPGGMKGVVCPAITVGQNCATCRLCTPDHPAWADAKFKGVGFPEHGNHVRRARKLPIADPVEQPATDAGDVGSADLVA